MTEGGEEGKGGVLSEDTHITTKPIDFLHINLRRLHRRVGNRVLRVDRRTRVIRRRRLIRRCSAVAHCRGVAVHGVHIPHLVRVAGGHAAFEGGDAFLDTEPAFFVGVTGDARGIYRSCFLRGCGGACGV